MAELTQVTYEHETGFEPVEQPVELPSVPEIGELSYTQRLLEINDSFRVLKDGSYSVEIAMVNQAYKDQELVIFPSTSLSSLTQNPGNAIELAARGAADPHTAFLYVAFPGNGHTSSFRAAEQKYRIQTGRYTTGGNGDVYKPLETIDAVARILTKNDLVPSHISADETGGRFGLALLAGMDHNVVRDGLLNGLPGVAPGTNYSVEMAKEDVSSRARRRSQEGAPGEVTPDRIQEAKELMPKIYGSIEQKTIAVSSIVMKGWFYNGPTTLLSVRGHNDLSHPASHALVQDSLAALSRQEALLTYQFNQASRLHDRAACIQLGRTVMASLPEDMADSRSIRILFGEGGLDAHTDEPAMRRRAERHALGSVTRFLVAVPNLSYRAAEEIAA